MTPDLEQKSNGASDEAIAYTREQYRTLSLDALANEHRHRLDESEDQCGMLLAAVSEYGDKIPASTVRSTLLTKGVRESVLETELAKYKTQPVATMPEPAPAEPAELPEIQRLRELNLLVQDAKTHGINAIEKRGSAITQLAYRLYEHHIIAAAMAEHGIEPGVEWGLREQKDPWNYRNDRQDHCIVRRRSSTKRNLFGFAREEWETETLGKVHMYCSSTTLSITSTIYDPAIKETVSQAVKMTAEDIRAALPTIPIEITGQTGGPYDSRMLDFLEKRIKEGKRG